MWSLLKEIQKQAKTKGFSHFIIKSLTPQEKKTLRIIYLIVFERTCSTNVTDIEENPKIYGQEEVDASIVSHAMDVCRKDPFSEMKIGCYNTDVLLILLSYSEQLPSTAVFQDNRASRNLWSKFARFTPRGCKALYVSMLWRRVTKLEGWVGSLKLKTRYWFSIIRIFRCCFLRWEQSPTGCEESWPS